MGHNRATRSMIGSRTCSLIPKKAFRRITSSERPEGLVLAASLRRLARVITGTFGQLTAATEPF